MSRAQLLAVHLQAWKSGVNAPLASEQLNFPSANVSFNENSPCLTFSLPALKCLSLPSAFLVSSRDAERWKNELADFKKWGHFFSSMLILMSYFGGESMFNNVCRALLIYRTKGKQTQQYIYKQKCIPIYIAHSLTLCKIYP